jgi:hypothetical protein
LVEKSKHLWPIIMLVMFMRSTHEDHGELMDVHGVLPAGVRTTAAPTDFPLPMEMREQVFLRRSKDLLDPKLFTHHPAHRG